MFWWKCINKRFDFLLNEPELNQLNQLFIRYQDIKGSGLIFYLNMQLSITHILYNFSSNFL